MTSAQERVVETGIDIYVVCRRAGATHDNANGAAQSYVRRQYPDLKFSVPDPANLNIADVYDAQLAAISVTIGAPLP